MKTTIIILLILAGVSLNAIVGDNGIINNAMDAKVISKFSGYNEELGITSVNDVGIYATGENLKIYIPSMEDEDLEKFVVIKSKLLYVGTDEKETEIADRLGIGGGSETSDAGATVKEVQAIVDGVVKVSEKNKEKIPKNDSDRLDELECKDDEKGLIGTRLFDRNGLNLTERTWNILIEYNNQNKETARFGSGYYWLKKGETYKIKGKEIEFKNDYVINYGNEEFTVLSGRAVNWNEKATLGVDTNIALNLDPMSFAVGRWEKSGDTDEVNKEEFEDFIVKDTDGKEKNTGIQKVGDVVYDDENKALKFNENEIDNPDGEGGYLRLSKNGLDFSNGFTFEMYTNLSRFAYANKIRTDLYNTALFCRMVSLNSDYTHSMRFGFNTGANPIGKNGIWLGRFSTSLKESTVSKNISVENKAFSGLVLSDYSKLRTNENIYLTYVIDVKEDEEVMFYFYINGELLGYCDYDMDCFEEGLGYWNNDNNKFFVGAYPGTCTGNIYYLKGLVYATRLYTAPLTPEQVKDSYDLSLKYRDSFKDEKF